MFEKNVRRVRGVRGIRKKCTKRVTTGISEGIVKWIRIILCQHKIKFIEHGKLIR